MRRHDRAITDVDTIHQIILNSNTGILCMVDDNRPYGIMINYGAKFENGNLTLLFHGAKEGRKIDCLRKNPEVSFFINDPSYTQLHDAGKAAAQWTTRYRSVIVTGIIRFIEDLNSKREAAETFMLHYRDEEVEIADAALNATAWLELKAVHISGKQNINPSRA